MLNLSVLTNYTFQYRSISTVFNSLNNHARYAHECPTVIVDCFLVAKTIFGIIITNSNLGHYTVYNYSRTGNFAEGIFCIAAAVYTEHQIASATANSTLFM